MNDGNDRDDDESAGLLGAIRGVLEALGGTERESRTDLRRSGRIPKGHFTTRYGFAGRIGEPAPDSTPESGSGERTEESFLIDVRHDEEGDELQVVADLPGVATDELTVGLDGKRDELVIGVEGRAVERVELPWPAESADGRYHHGVLELRFVPRTRGEDE